MNRMNLYPIAALALLGVLVAAPSAPAAGDDKKVVGDPYPLATCAVAGTKLGSMGDPYVHVYEGREVRFCCKGCLGQFEEDPKAVLAKVDEQIIKQQMKHYPLETCLVMEDEPLGGEDVEPVMLVYHNRLVRFCCGGCEKKFKKDPDGYLARLDKAVIAKQLKGYPLSTCPVSGEKLGSMGDPVDVVIANRLVRLCCKGCTKGLRQNPLKALAMLDAAGGAAAAATEDLRDVSFKGLATSIPASWDEYAPTSGMRELNARILDSDGKESAELIVFFFGPNGAGPVDANIERWARQFRTPDGLSVDPETREMSVDGMRVTLVELVGEYQGMGADDFIEGQAALNAIVQGPAGPVYFKLAGDEDTVNEHRAAFMKMIKALRRADAP